MEEIKVLYIDDEIANLTSFKAAFRFDYKILIAKSIAEAVTFLIQHPDIHIILCDQRMPEKSGVEFLEEIRAKFPKPVRMLVTGYTDIEPLIAAVNRGNVYRFIKKPWSDLEMKSAIEEGYRYYLTNSLLAKKNEELHNAYKLLDEFAYNVTHGLRDPILSVLSLVEIGQNMDNVPEEVREILDMVGHAMVQLDSYIENTRDYHTLKSGESQMAEIFFKDVINSLKDAYQLEADKKGVRFDVQVKQDEPFETNISLLNIVVNNLLSNAFKYQKKQGTDKFVELNVNVTPEAAIITVKDNGIGIHNDHMKHVFDPLYRATAEEYGSGLGLYNVKDALLKLKGDIYVDSQLNEGTTFKVIIPSKKKYE